MFKSEKGITLVALVVTIIVLLILAGITLTLAISDNGILGRASEARVAQVEAHVKEHVELAILSARTEILAEQASVPTYVASAKDVKGYLQSALAETGYTYTVTTDAEDTDTTATFVITCTSATYDNAVGTGTNIVLTYKNVSLASNTVQAASGAKLYSEATKNTRLESAQGT